MSKKSDLVEIVESYVDYTPPFDPNPVIRWLLRRLPPQDLDGLGHVLLTNSSGLSRKSRRSKSRAHGKSFPYGNALGHYHHAWEGKKPYISLFVDNLAKDRKFSWWWAMWKFGETLYHEVGHHVDHSTRPQYGNIETIAENYARDHLFPVLMTSPRYWLSKAAFFCNPFRWPMLYDLFTLYRRSASKRAALTERKKLKKK
jgi:hypothetical protein